MNASSSKRAKRTYPSEDLNFWQHHIEQMHKSKLSKAAYCRRHNINYDRAQYWSNRLKEISASPLLPVTVTPSRTVAQQTERARCFSCQLELGKGIKLTITSSEMLDAVLDKVMRYASVI